jgi:hypothetical protein
VKSILKKGKNRKREKEQAVEKNITHINWYHRNIAEARRENKKRKDVTGPPDHRKLPAVRRAHIMYDVS